jgi:hypothetical protein
LEFGEVPQVQAALLEKKAETTKVKTKEYPALTLVKPDVDNESEQEIKVS